MHCVTHLLLEHTLQDLVVVDKLVVVSGIPLHFAHWYSAWKHSVADLASHSTCHHNKSATITRRLLDRYCTSPDAVSSILPMLNSNVSLIHEMMAFRPTK